MSTSKEHGSILTWLVFHKNLPDDSFSSQPARVVSVEDGAKGSWAKGSITPGRACINWRITRARSTPVEKLSGKPLSTWHELEPREPVF